MNAARQLASGMLNTGLVVIFLMLITSPGASYSVKQVRERLKRAWALIAGTARTLAAPAVPIAAGGRGKVA